MPNIIGQTFLNQYRVDEFVASGGMGAVYKAWDIKRSVYLAMKVLHADMVDDPSAFKFFQREAVALQKLAHPNIVPFYGLFQTGTFSFMLQQFIDGPSLRDILKENPNGLPISEALAYARALCSALGYAHVNGVVHCDLKPGNVMVDRGGRIYLTDFGIARHAQGTVTSTMAGSGTPAYMSSEQIMRRPVTPASDIYALGIVLFELLTGRRPFRGDEPELMSHGSTTGERLIYAHLNLRPPDIRRINASIPAALAQIIIKCMAKNPQERYASTGDLLTALVALGFPMLDRVPPRMLTETMTSIPPTMTAPPPFTTQAPPKKPSPILWMGVAGLVGIGLICAAVVAWMIFGPQNRPLVPPTITPIPPLPWSTSTFTPLPGLTFTPAPPIIPSDTPTAYVPPTYTPTFPPPVTYDLAFVSDRGNSFGDLHPFVVNSNNLADYKQLENPPGYNRAQWPSFCGNQLAIEALDTGGNRKQWIFIYDQSGQANMWEKSASAAQLGVPRCSPNGQYMAYSVDRSDGYWDLVVADITSGEIIYRPDARNYGKIAGYTSWKNSSSFIFEAVSPKDRYLSVDNFLSSPTPREISFGKEGVHATLSPDGTKAAFSCDTGQLCVADLSTGSTRNIYQTNFSVNVTDWVEKVTPVWSADSQWIYFATVDGGDWDIFRIHPDGSNMQNMTASWPSNEIMPTTR